MNKTLLIVGIIITGLSLLALTVFSLSKTILKFIYREEEKLKTNEQKHKSKVSKRIVKVSKTFIKSVNKQLVKYYIAMYGVATATLTGGVAMVTYSSVQIVQEEKIKRAQDETPKTYNVTWLNYDGTELEKDLDVAEGTTPSYDGTTPVKAPTETKEYVFNGWTPAVTPVSSDVTYTAVFTEQTRKYNIRYETEEGDLLRVDMVPYGEVPDYGGDPTLDSTAQYSYAFVSWDREFEPVSGDATYVARFTSTVNKYTITWYDDGDILIDSKEYEYGEMPSIDWQTSKENELEGYYTFRGWDHPYHPVTQDESYGATYNFTYYVGTVTWEDDEHNPLYVETDVEFGSIPTYKGMTPYKEGMVFDGWDREVTPLYDGDVTYTATFREAEEEYTVYFYSSDDPNVYYDSSIEPYSTYEALEGSTVGQGPTPTAEHPDEYEFVAWYSNKDLTGDPFDFDTPITEDIKLYAKYIRIWTITYTYNDSAVFIVNVPDGSVLVPYEYQVSEDPLEYVTTWYDTEVGLSEPFDFSTRIYRDYVLFG